jgi:hypothetical protein
VADWTTAELFAQLPACDLAYYAHYKRAVFKLSRILFLKSILNIKTKKLVYLQGQREVGVSWHQTISEVEPALIKTGQLEEPLSGAWNRNDRPAAYDWPKVPVHRRKIISAFASIRINPFKFQPRDLIKNVSISSRPLKPSAPDI